MHRSNNYIELKAHYLVSAVVELGSHGHHGMFNDSMSHTISPYRVIYNMHCMMFTLIIVVIDSRNLF